VVGHIFQHRHEARIAQGVGQARQGGPAEGSQSAAGQLEAGQPRQLVVGRHEHGQLRCTGPLASLRFHGGDERCHRIQPFLFHQQR
jgi:hypothetical protein